MTTIVQATDLGKQYGKRWALENLTGAPGATRSIAWKPLEAPGATRSIAWKPRDSLILEPVFV
jgi:hypothetical protein